MTQETKNLNDSAFKELIENIKIYSFTNTVVFYSEETYKNPKQKKDFVKYLGKYIYMSLGKKMSVEVRMPTEEYREGTLNLAYSPENDTSGKGLTLADILFGK